MRLVGTLFGSLFLCSVILSDLTMAGETCSFTEGGTSFSIFCENGCCSNECCPSDGVDTEAIAIGISVALALLLLLLLILLIIYCCWKRNKKEKEKELLKENTESESSGSHVIAMTSLHHASKTNKVMAEPVPHKQRQKEIPTKKNERGQEPIKFVPVKNNPNPKPPTRVYKETVNKLLQTNESTAAKGKVIWGNANRWTSAKPSRPVGHSGQWAASRKSKGPEKGIQTIDEDDNGSESVPQTPYVSREKSINTPFPSNSDPTRTTKLYDPYRAAKKQGYISSWTPLAPWRPHGNAHSLDKSLDSIEKPLDTHLHYAPKPGDLNTYPVHSKCVSRELDRKYYHDDSRSQSIFNSRSRTFVDSEIISEDSNITPK